MDFDNAHHWITGLNRIEVLTPGPVGLGTRFNETRTVAGHTETQLIEITNFDPPSRYTATARIKGGEISYTYHLADSPDGATEIQLVGEVRGSSMLFKPFALVGLAMMKKVDGDQLDRLKDVLERS